MRLFISGGGSGKDTIKANEKFKEVLNNDERPLLYIPLAMTKYSLDSCYEWIKKELKDVNLTEIKMIRTIEELELENFNKYCAIFIGGGNTYKLLSLLKSNTSFDKLKEYIQNDGIVYGGSAGAVILGHTIDTVEPIDINNVKLEDTYGLGCIDQFSIYPHYTKEKVEEVKYLKEFYKSKVLALPNNTTIYYSKGRYEILGNKNYSIFDFGYEIKFNEDINLVKEKFYNLKTPEELMDFMNNNITYGWIDKNNYIHYNNLYKFREDYKVNTIEQILSNKIGTCLDQANLIKYFFDRVGIENKLFCKRIYEDELTTIGDINMHGINLFKQNDKWYNFEYANQMERGIHQYDSIEIALKEIMTGLSTKEKEMSTEIKEFKENSSFLEINLDLNNI